MVSECKINVTSHLSLFSFSFNLTQFDSFEVPSLCHRHGNCSKAGGSDGRNPFESSRLRLRSWQQDATGHQHINAVIVFIALIPLQYL